MSYQATVFNVVIASPGDVATERMIVRDVIQDWNAANSKSRGIALQAIGWDSHSYPSMEDTAQGVLNGQILADADLLIAVFWTRLGTPTKVAPSGTVEEIERHIAAGRHAMIYFSDRDIPRVHDHEQLTRLNDFRAQCETRGLVRPYTSHEDFKDKVTLHLAMAINNQRQFLAQQPKANQDPLSSLSQFGLPDFEQSMREQKRDRLSAEARQLLLGAAVDSRGQILRAETKDGLEIVTNGKNHVPESSPRDRVRWDAALNELRMASLLKVIQHNQLYEVTDEGYQMADLLRIEDLI